MRYVTMLLRPSDGWFHETGRRLFEDPQITPIALHHIDLLADGTAIGLYEVEGDLNHVRERFDGIESMHDCRCSDVGGSVMVYSHYDPNPDLRQVLTPLRRFEIVLDTPVEFTPEGPQVTLIGEERTLQRAVDDYLSVTDLTVERTGDYRPREERLVATLTDRQREVLRVARELGYYRTPREATYEDIAAELDCTAGTIAEHVQRIEGRLVSALGPVHGETSGEEVADAAEETADRSHRGGTDDPADV